MRFCLKFLQINGRILRRNLHFIEKMPCWESTYSQHGFLSFWICFLIRSQLVCVVSISISCISDLILTCSRIQKKGISATFQIFSKKKKVPKNQHFFIYYPCFLDIKTTHSTYLDTLELITYADLFPRRYVFGNKSAIFPFLGRSRVWMYILRQSVSMIWFVIESQELSFHAFLFDAIILVRIPEQTHFRWQNQND